MINHKSHITNHTRHNYLQLYNSCMLLLLLIRTFSVLSLQVKKLWRHNKSAIDLSNANPACGHREVRRSTGHIMVTTRYDTQTNRDPDHDNNILHFTVCTYGQSQTYSLIIARVWININRAGKGCQSCSWSAEQGR